MITNSRHHLSRTVILAGSGRSGTTWLGNIIAANPNFRIIFEPFEQNHVPQAAILPRRSYARPSNTYPEWIPFVKDALSGKINNKWIQRDGNRWWAPRILVKEIRANLMLGWIDRTFHPKIVFIIRHPCAVVLSRLKLKWTINLSGLLLQSELVADYLDPFVDLILRAKTEAQKQAVLWSVENLVPLSQLREFGWIFCTYEHLYCDPDNEVNRILKGLEIRKTVLTQRAIRQVSMVTRSDSPIVKRENPLAEWQKRLTKKETDDILRVVEAFGINLYCDAVMPDLRFLSWL